MAPDYEIVQKSDSNRDKSGFEAQNAQLPKYIPESRAEGTAKRPGTQQVQRHNKITLELLPSYLQRRGEVGPRQLNDARRYNMSEKIQEHAVALKRKEYIKHLDGLRGIATLFMFNHHFLYPWTYTILHGFGTSDRNRFIHQMPLLCLMVRGQAMVALLFAVSGYVLSRKVLQLARQRDIQTELNLLRPLSAYSIRRAIRLYGPPIISMALVAATVRLGAFDRGATVQRGEKDGTYWLSGSREAHPEKLANSLAQLLNFLSTLRSWSDPWRWNITYNHYDPHTWMIPVELRCSIILFVVLLATSRLRSPWRPIIITIVAIQALRSGRWEITIFLGSMVLAEVDPIPRDFKDEKRHREESSSAKLAVLAFSGSIMGLYMLSFPDLDPELSPGFKTLASWTPRAYKSQHLFWHAIGSLMVLWCTNNSMPLRKILEGQFCQYFGKISFAFYLVHGPLLHSAGLAIMPAIWRWTGHRSYIGFTCGLSIGWIVMLFLSTWAAEVFWQLVDMPCKKLAKTVEGIVSSRRVTIPT